MIVLAEQAQPDPSAAPSLRYRRTRAQPVKDQAGNQALVQLFTRTKAHRHQPAAQPPAQPTPPPAAADGDGDGTRDTADCAPANASIHPDAADAPDLDFVDSNCDGIDGTGRDAIFVAPNGNDANPGTKAKPKRQIAAALAAAATGKKQYVLVAFGSYGQVSLSSDTSIYGGYDPASWSVATATPTGSRSSAASGRPYSARAPRASSSSTSRSGERVGRRPPGRAPTAFARSAARA